MRDLHSQSAAIASRSPSENVPSAEGQRCTSVAVLPRFPHRRHNVEATWKAARSWLTLAYPAGLAAALGELRARFPELAQNISRLEVAAQQEAQRFENEPDADMSGFLAALGPWEKAMLDGLAALAQPEGRTQHA